VHVHGDFLPRHIFGKFHLPCALLRFVFLSLRWLYDNWRNPQDVVFVDQISATVPLLRVSGAKVVFYCHFPDQLLTQRKSLLKKLYRLPLDLLEEITTAQADQILVNSRFTAGVFKDTFRRIKIVPAVLYPAVDHSNFIESDPKIRLKAPFFLSLNRFEGKKGHDLAVKALNIVRNEGYANTKLVIAGGFDKRLQDNRDTLAGLEKLVTEFKLENNVEFKPSVPDAERNTLLTTCIAVLYTPINEHFGIVPLEAALSGAPVIACNSGGPLETVKDSNTGYLCPPEPERFASAMMSLLDEPQLVAEMGRNGRRHVLDNFSVQLFGDNLERLLKE
jgi:alpha-1,3/alpha-1,6-mannosyltransferase